MFVSLHLSLRRLSVLARALATTDLLMSRPPISCYLLCVTPCEQETLQTDSEEVDAFIQPFGAYRTMDLLIVKRDQMVADVFADAMRARCPFLSVVYLAALWPAVLNRK
jgi:hypothetical protein